MIKKHDFTSKTERAIYAMGREYLTVDNDIFQDPTSLIELSEQ